MRRFVATAGLYLGVLVVVYIAVTAGRAPAPPGEQAGTPSESPAPLEDIQLAAALEPFDGCDDLLAYFKREGLERVGPYGLAPPMFYGVDDGALLGGAGAAEGGARAVAGDTAAAAPGAAAPDAAGAEQPEFSGTNVQETGVDEPDRVKTDGTRLIVLAGERLQVMGISAEGVKRLSTLRLPGAWGSEMLLDGDHVLVMGHSQSEVVPQPLPGPAVSDRTATYPAMGSPISEFAVVDISDPADPQITSTLTVDGSYVSARMVDGVARIVVRSQPTSLPFVMPEAGGLRAEREATERNREVIRDSTIDQWLPYSVTTSAAGDEHEQQLLDCAAVHHPQKFAGFGMVSVLSVDLDDDLTPNGTGGVVGDADTVYASTGSVYLALNSWNAAVSGDVVTADPSAVTTSIHQFDISDPLAARYVASGSVDGRLLNQWAMSEHEDVLRVATTLDDPSGQRSSSSVVVLRADGSKLREIGRVDGLGKGEQIYAVRYEGPIGYVVTFRQTDPLYTLDLSEPTEPKVKGELKIDGYSAYLHPVGDGRVIGVGQDANKRGELKGSQVSLFDVSNLSEPRRIDQIAMGPSNSPIEYDHRAFLYWPATRTVVVPLQIYDVLPLPSRSKAPFNGAVVLRAGSNELRRQGEVQHPAGAGDPTGKGGVPAIDYGYGGPTIYRSLVVDDALVTISEVGVMVTDLEDLQRRDWAEFRL